MTSDPQKIPTLIVVAAALLRDGGEVLLQQRAEGWDMAGLWEFPGGKLEPGERPEQALVRELHEELGITVGEQALEPAFFASAPLSKRHLILLLYLVRQWDGAPRALEASALEWVRPERMNDYPMPPADVPLVAWLQRLLQP